MYGNLALARDYLAELDDFYHKTEGVRALDLTLLRLYKMRSLPQRDGAMGQNLRTYRSVAYQRNALDFIIYGVATDDVASIRYGLQALRYAFRHKEEDGGFKVGPLLRRRADFGTQLSHTSLFLASAGIIYQLLYYSQFRYRLLKPLVQLRQDLKHAINWLAKHDLKLFFNDQDSAYHLINDALAYAINGEITENHALINRGQIFLDLVLEMQREDGAFLEFNGHDSSYQASVTIQLLYYLIFAKERSYFNKVVDSVALGIAWEKTRILADGEINAENNTRKSVSYATFSGRIDDICYSDVVKAFLLYSHFTGDTESRQLARKVFRFISQQSHGQA